MSFFNTLTAKNFSLSLSFASITCKNHGGRFILDSEAIRHVKKNGALPVSSFALLLETLVCKYFHIKQHMLFTLHAHFPINWHAGWNRFFTAARARQLQLKAFLKPARVDTGCKQARLALLNLHKLIGSDTAESLQRCSLFSKGNVWASYGKGRAAAVPSSGHNFKEAHLKQSNKRSLALHIHVNSNTVNILCLYNFVTNVIICNKSHMTRAAFPWQVFLQK